MHGEKVKKHKGRPIRIASDFSREMVKARRTWTDVPQTLKDDRYQPYYTLLKIQIALDKKIRYSMTKNIQTISFYYLSNTEDTRKKIPTQGG